MQGLLNKTILLLHAWYDMLLQADGWTNEQPNEQMNE